MPRHHAEVISPATAAAVDRLGRSVPLLAVLETDAHLYYRRPVLANEEISAVERWVLPEHGWVVTRFTQRPDARRWIDWYIDIDDAVCVDGCWRIEDRLLDVGVVHGERYITMDADELADAMTDGSITLDQATAALRAQQALCRLLEESAFDVPALLARLAPDLPQP